jgi:hypothetical protein
MKPLADTDASRLAVSVHDGIAAIERFASEIDRLNLASARPNPFLSSAFLTCYASYSDHYTPGQQVRLFLIRDGDQLIGCAPMRRASDGWGGGRLRLLGPLDTDRPGMLSSLEDEHRVATALVRHLCAHERGWGMVEFFGQQRGNALHLATHAAASSRFRTRDIELEPYNEIPLAFENLSAYYRSLSPKMRSNIGRQTRRLFSNGEPELVLAEGPQATSAWFDAYCDLDGRSWKHGTDASIRRHARRVRFYREIAAARGGLDPSFIGVVLEGALIAGLLVGSNQTASPGFHGAWCLEMAYDQSQAELGPGQLLLLLAVAEAIRRGDRHLSFMQNFSYYKHRWKAEAIEAVSVQLIRRASLQNVRASLGELKKRWLERRGPPSTQAEGHHDATRAAKHRATAAPQAQEYARGLVSSALGFTGSGVRRLNREQAHAYLPFDLG